MAIDLTKLSTLLTSHKSTALKELKLKDSTNQEISKYFTAQKSQNKTPAAADTLAEVAAYDTNHDGKIDRSERKAAGLTRSQAKAFNKALKSFQTENNLTAEQGADNNTTDYKDAQGNKVFSITALNNGTKTEFYDKDGKVTKTVTEDENGITTEETNGNTKTTTTEYSEAKTAQNGGVKKSVTTAATNDDGTTTTTVTHTFEGRKDGLKEQKIEYSSDTERTVTQTYENGESTTVTQTKNSDGEWKIKTAAETPPADKTAAAKKAQDVFKENKSVTIDESGSTNLINKNGEDGKWTTNVRIADDAEYNDAGYPKKLSIELPSEYNRNGKTRVQNLTLVDGTDNVYSSGGGRRYYRMTVGEDGSITIKHVHYDSATKEVSELTEEDNAKLKAKLDNDIEVAKQKAEAAKKDAEAKKVTGDNGYYAVKDKNGNIKYYDPSGKEITGDEFKKACPNIYESVNTSKVTGDNGYYAVKDKNGNIKYYDPSGKEITGDEFKKACPNIYKSVKN